jgi:formate dehydrogenase major subunit
MAHSNGDDTGGTLQGKRGDVKGSVHYSEDPRDYGYMADNVPCQNACPALTNIPGYIRCVFEKRYGRAYELNRMCNIFPGVLGRICARPCEVRCRHGEDDLGKPVNICHIKRAAYDHKSPMHRIEEHLYAPSGKTVAIIGAGPAGLSATHELSAMGHRVTVYEALPKPGGMLTYGIPAFRLPRDVLELEIENILRLGVTLETSVRIGKDLSFKDLTRQFDAVITTVGCMQDIRLKLPGEELEGFYSGLDFMMRFNTGQPIGDMGRVVVIGGGFTAADCTRSAARLGASPVSVNIRATEEYMRIDEHEKAELKFEDVRIFSLVSPKRFLGTNGKLEGVEFIRTRLDHAGGNDRPRAVPIQDSEFIVAADTVIAAVGQRPRNDFEEGLTYGPGGTILTAKNSYGTDLEGVFAAGDCASGSSDVISAVANGRRAAWEVDSRFAGSRRKSVVVRLEPAPQTDRNRDYDFIEQVPMPSLPLSERLISTTKEVETGYADKQAEEESKRCYLCNLKYTIDVDRCIYCFACIDVAPRDCIKMISYIDIEPDGTYGEYMETRIWEDIAAIAIDNKRCIRCGKCHDVCPVQCISIDKAELIEKDKD